MKPLTILLALLLITPFAFADTPNYTKYGGNPLQYDPTNTYAYAHGYGGEMTAVVEGRYIYRLQHRQSPAGVHYIFFNNNTDPYNNTLGQRIYQFDGSTMPYIARVGEIGTDSQRINGTFHIFVMTSSVIYHYTTTNFLNYTDYCGGATLHDEDHYNTAVHYDPATNTWDMLVDGTLGFHTKYYNSTDGCTWNNQGYILGSTAFNSDLNKLNKTYEAYYSIFDGGGYTIAHAQGNRPDNLTQDRADVFENLSVQAWETGLGGGTYDWSDPELLVIPNSSLSYFDKKFYLYYLGDQNNTGVATDSQNRSVYTAHSLNEPYSNATPPTPPTPPSPTPSARDTTTASGIALMFIVLALISGMMWRGFDAETKEKYNIIFYICVVALILAVISLL